MNDKFFDLKKEKQDRMINAALKIFAQQGYKHASTDDIVKEAAISKGLLFHYFGSKIGIYEFVYEYSVRYMVLELSTVVPGYEHNLFEVMKYIELAHINAMKGYPYIQQFLNRVAQEDVSEALLVIEDKKHILEEEYSRLEAQIRYSDLPKGVEGHKLIKVLKYTMNGLMTERFADASFQPEMLYEEMVGYLDMMKSLT